MTYALPSLPREVGATKHCTGCDNDLPRSSFYARKSGKLSSRCKLCISAANAAHQRNTIDPVRRAHAERIQREQEARQTAKDYRRAQRAAEVEALRRLGATEGVPEGHKRCIGCTTVLPIDSYPIKGGKRLIRCRACLAAYNREWYHRKHGRTGSGVARGTLTPERRAEIAERLTHLTAILTGTAANERISTQEGWDVATSELLKLWHLSGDKVCVTCKETVPPEHMPPPGPANFYPGHCRRCAGIAAEGNHRRTFGPLIGPLRGSPKIPMRDGTAITVAELARRVRERQAARRR